MSITTVPDNIKNDTSNKYVEDALELMSNNYISITQYQTNVRAGQNLLKEMFVMQQPVGLRRTEGGTIYQVGEMVLRKLQVPSATYYLQADDIASSSYIGTIIKDGVESVMEMGGFEGCMIGKQGIFSNGVYYGDGHILIGKGKDVPITYATVNPDQIYLDAACSSLHSSTNGRKVTRMLLIYSYDYDQAIQEYPGVKFGLGKIPSQNTYYKDFDKTWTQETQATDRQVQIAHYFDVGGDEPVHLIFAGGACTIVGKIEKGDDYPHFDGRTGKPYIPVDNFAVMPSFEGYFNYGLLNLLYKYHISRRQLFNKAISQSMNSMDDTQVINTPMGKQAEMLTRIRQAREAAQNGKMGVIVNDSGEAVTVTRLQSDQYEQSISLLDQWFDKELKRFGFNIDAIREQTSTTATQILAEAGVEDELIATYIDRNTQFFKRMHYWTMDAILANVKNNDDTPIWTTLKMPVKDDGGQPVMNQLTGAPVQQPVVITLGELKTLIKKYRKGMWVEIDTKSGVKERDNIKTARALLALRTSQIPGVQSAALKMLMQANNMQIDGSVIDQQVQQQQVASSAQAGQVSKEMIEQKLP